MAIFKYPNNSLFDKCMNCLIELIISSCYIIAFILAVYDFKEIYFNLYTR